jgi:hypothetical protein
MLWIILLDKRNPRYGINSLASSLFSRSIDRCKITSTSQPKAVSYVKAQLAFPPTTCESTRCGIAFRIAAAAKFQLHLQIGSDAGEAKFNCNRGHLEN